MILNPLIAGYFSRPFRVLAAVLLIAGQLTGAGHVHAHDHDHCDHHEHQTHDHAAGGHESPGHEDHHHNCDTCRLAGRDHDAILADAPFYRVPAATVYTPQATPEAALIAIKQPLTYQGRAPPLA